MFTAVAAAVPSVGSTTAYHSTDSMRNRGASSLVSAKARTLFSIANFSHKDRTLSLFKRQLEVHNNDSVPRAV